MCGIAGILSPGAREPSSLRQTLEAVTAALIRRGPDGQGFHVETTDASSIALGHRRLAVIDVAGGAQPLYAADGRVAGIVNGEIFNFTDLRRRLEARGHRFVTRSDSEVVVHGYAEWGVEVLGRLEGHFALAVWDGREQRLLLARDRMGEKPLYYAERNGSVIFASELKALLRHCDIAPELDPTALAEYLLYEYVPAPRTILAGVRKLSPGEYLVAGVDGRPGQSPGKSPGQSQRRLLVEVGRYWDLPLHQEHRLTDLDAAAQALRRALRRSVASRLVADVPLGVFLSGGLDSSLVAALARQVHTGEVATFSLGFAEPSYDESRHARLVARHLGTSHHELVARADDALALIGELGQLLDEPLADASIVPTHLLARFTRSHVTVALSGDGGDELFDGYPTIQADFLLRHAVDRAPRWLARGLRRAVAATASALPVSADNFSLDFKLKQLARGMNERGPRRHQAWLASFLPHEVLAVLSRDVAAALGEVDLYGVVAERMARFARARGPAAAAMNATCRRRCAADERMYFYCKGYLGDGVLAKVDRASMHVALEVRAPLLDTAVIALACRVTPALRSRGWHTKRLLKRAARGLLPDAIIDRPKHGFGMPLAAWLRGPLAELLQDTLAPDRLRRDGLLDAGAVEAMTRAHLSGAGNHRKPLWTLLAFHAWLDAVR